MILALLVSFAAVSLVAEEQLVLVKYEVPQPSRSGWFRIRPDATPVRTPTGGERLVTLKPVTVAAGQFPSRDLASEITLKPSTLWDGVNYDSNPGFPGAKERQDTVLLTPVRKGPVSAGVLMAFEGPMSSVGPHKGTSLVGVGLRVDKNPFAFLSPKGDR
jgi:hypothetical protein